MRRRLGGLQILILGGNPEKRYELCQYLRVLISEGVSGQILSDLDCLEANLKENTSHRTLKFVEKLRAKRNTYTQGFVDYFKAPWKSWKV